MAETTMGGAATTTRPGLAAVRFPQLGESVVEGTVLQWFVKEGETVKEDQPLVEIETEKVVAEIPSPFEGTVQSFAVEVGQTVPVGTVLMYIATEGAADGAPTDAVATGVPAAEATGTAVPPTTRDPETDAMTTGMTHATTPPAATSAPTATNGNAPAATNGAGAPAAPPAASTVTNGTTGYVEPADASVRYSPAVRKLAKEFGIDPGTVKGTGAGGRVTRDDMMRAHTERANATVPAAATAPTVSAAPAAPATAPSPAAPPAPARPAPAAAPAAVEGDLIPMTTLRRRTAEALVRAAQTIPQAATWAEADVTDLVRRRDAEKETFRAREGVSLTFLPFFVQAALAGVRQYPIISSQWTDEGIRLKRQVGMGIAVSTDEGLVVPVIHNAGDYSITGLARALDDKIRRARAGKLTLDDIQGGSLTLTNPGSFGSLRTMALVRPNEAGMFSVDAIVEKPVVRNGGIAIRSIVTIGLSFDHRIFDGREAVLFLNAVKEWLETQAASVPL